MLAPSRSAKPSTPPYRPSSIPGRDPYAKHAYPSARFLATQIRTLARKRVGMMPRPLSETEVRGIEARFQRATPGPWVARSAPTGIRGSVPYAWVFREGDKFGAIFERHNSGTLADIDFAAQARTDVPRLSETFWIHTARIAELEDLLADVLPALAQGHTALKHAGLLAIADHVAAVRARVNLALMPPQIDTGIL